MLKFLGFLFVVGITFAIGYQMGREGPDVIVKKAKELSTEVMTRGCAASLGFLRTGGND